MLQTDFLTSYGYDYQRDIQPWVGKQILFAYLYDRGAKVEKAVAENVPKQQIVTLLPIANEGAAKQALERTKIPIDANLVESNYKGVAIREFKRKTGTIAIISIAKRCGPSCGSGCNSGRDSRRNWKNLKTANPNVISDTAARIHAISVRSWARRVRSTAN